MDENLDAERRSKEWNWQAMADRVNTLWGLKTTDRQLKQIGRDNISRVPDRRRPRRSLATST